MQHVTVTTGARLHFGLLSVNPQRKRIFGGLGMMIDEPGLQICVERADADLFVAESLETRTRLQNFCAACRADGIGQLPVTIRVHDTIPGHAGFGSGTQLGLAVASALNTLSASDRSLDELACAVGRGQRSAIGIHGFRAGGFLVDGGRVRTSSDIGRLAARVEWPHAWRIVLIAPRAGIGLHGAAERSAFRAMSAMPESLTQYLCMTTLMEILPALQSMSFRDFCDSLDDFGNAVGDFFASSQGGRFADPSIATLVNDLRAQEFSGLVQSSWGPTLCAVARNQAHAESIARFIAHHDLDFSTRIVRGLNSGAQIRVHDEATV